MLVAYHFHVVGHVFRVGFILCHEIQGLFYGHRSCSRLCRSFDGFSWLCKKWWRWWLNWLKLSSTLSIGCCIRHYRERRAKPVIGGFNCVVHWGIIFEHGLLFDSHRWRHLLMFFLWEEGIRSFWVGRKHFMAFNDTCEKGRPWIGR